jgi:hypothetical protein
MIRTTTIRSSRPDTAKRKPQVANEKPARVQWRQGDVLFEQAVPPVPELTPRGGDVLFSGEATGHAHRVRSPDGARAQVMLAADKRLFLRVGPQGAEILHEEHRPLELEEGLYRVWRQVEYDPRGSRAVLD